MMTNKQHRTVFDVLNNPIVHGTKQAGSRAIFFRGTHHQQIIWLTLRFLQYTPCNLLSPRDAGDKACRD